MDTDEIPLEKFKNSISTKSFLMKMSHSFQERKPGITLKHECIEKIYSFLNTLQREEYLDYRRNYWSAIIKRNKLKNVHPLLNFRQFKASQKDTTCENFEYLWTECFLLITKFLNQHGCAECSLQNLNETDYPK